MKTKIRVKRAELITVVEGRARKAENEFKRATDAYPKKVSDWETACVTKIETALVNAHKGKFPEDRYGNRSLTFPASPTKPSEDRSLCNLRRMLTTLKMGADDTLMLSQEDADDYFGPCKI